MSDFRLKLKLIYVPYLLMGAGFTLLYTLLHWLLIIKLQLFLLDEDLIHFWLPTVILLVVMFIWLRPRTKLLKIKNDGRSDIPSLYVFVACGFFIGAVITAQSWISAASGKLTQLDHITAIGNYPLTKYYKLNRFYIDKSKYMVSPRFETSGRYNEYFDMYLYVVCPITDSKDSVPPNISAIHFQKDKHQVVVIDGRVYLDLLVLKRLAPAAVQEVTILKGEVAIQLYGLAASDGAVLITTKGSNYRYLPSRQPVAWLGVRYNRQVSNHLSNEEKEAAYKDFAKNTFDEFWNAKLQQFVYLERMGKNDRLKGYTNAVRKIYPDVSYNPIFVEAVNEPFGARAGNDLFWVLGLMIGGAVVWLIMIAIPGLKTKEAEAFMEKSSKAGVWDIKQIFPLAWGNVWPGTTLIVGLNALVFIVMVFCGLGFISFTGPDLLKWGADYRPLTVNGEWWRLLTSMFLHGGLMHLLMNMYGFVFVAIFLEPLLKTKKFLTAYLLSGLCSSLASIWWHPATVSVGASGAIFGMYGLFLALMLTRRVPSVITKGLLVSILIFVVLNLGIGLTGGIDNAAHIGGLISGFIIGLIFSFVSPRVEPVPNEEIVDEKLNEEDLHLH